MELNSLLFPAPTTTYKPEDLEGEVMYIPRYHRYNRKTRKHLQEVAIEREERETRRKERLNEKIKRAELQ